MTETTKPETANGGRVALTATVRRDHDEMLTLWYAVVIATAKHFGLSPEKISSAMTIDKIKSAYEIF